MRVCVRALALRTSRDAAVHLSEARVSLLGEQGFCLVDALARLVHSAGADAGHGHLPVEGSTVKREQERDEAQIKTQTVKPQM